MSKQSVYNSNMSTPDTTTRDGYIQHLANTREPEAPPPRDIRKEIQQLLRLSNRAGNRLTRQNMRQLRRAYGEYQDMFYLGQDRGQNEGIQDINQRGGQVRQSLINASPEIRRLTEMAAEAGPSTIETELTRQAESDLLLGRSLSPEQQRDAAQQSRAGLAARGLGGGAGALAREVLNRDSYATQREAMRRTFAGGVEGMNQQRIGNDRTFVGGVASYLDPQTRLAAMRTPDPSSAMPLLGGQQIWNYGSAANSQNAANQQNAYNSQMGNYQNQMNALGSYHNAQMNQQWSQQNNAANAKAGQNAALASAGAGIATAALLAFALCWVAREVYGKENPQWLVFRRWLTTKAPAWLVRAYVRRGPAFARWLNSRPHARRALRPVFNLACSFA